MRDPRDEERLKKLRERLYSRGERPEARKRHELKGERKKGVPERWTEPARSRIDQPMETRPPTAKRSASPILAGYVGSSAPGVSASEAEQSQAPGAPFQSNAMARKSNRNTIRKKIVVGGVVFFVVALVLSSAFLFFGQNTISGDNISIDVKGPFAIGGGQEIPLQIAISNQNTVPIESATLIIEYPAGTQSAEEPGKELFRDRKQLEPLSTGEVMNIPVRAIVFGEENEEKTINVFVEYRVRGSNATFFKEAQPLTFKISSSPVVLLVDSVRQVSSGQEVEIELRVASNATSPISDVLVKAEYPFGFDYSEAEPSPDAGQDTWVISELEPEEEEVIVVKGVIIGKQNEERIFRFSLGVANERDRFGLASIFTTATVEMVVEQPFLDLQVEINRDDSEVVAIGRDEVAAVEVVFTNTLSDTIYDAEVEIALEGTALDDSQVQVSQGFYDSSSNRILWDSTALSQLNEIPPGEKRTLRFTLTPIDDDGTVRTPQLNMSISMKGRRVFENRVPTTLSSVLERTIRVESRTSIASEALYSTGKFVNTGPIPPIAEEVTTYTIVLTAQNGSNEVTGAEVTAELPTYITWLGLISGKGTIEYNSAQREIIWDIGDMEANDRETIQFQVSFLPSVTQIGSVPTILGQQRFRATDRFTETVLRADTPALTTFLEDSDPDPDTWDGRIRAAEEE